MKKYISQSALLILFCFYGNNLEANNLRITNFSNTNPGEVNPIITFDIAWDNSWRVSAEPNNHDAIWVFVKCQQVPSWLINCESYQEWTHAPMTNVSGDFSVGSPLEIVLVNDSMGIFIRRSSDIIGNVNTTSVSIRLNLPVPISPFAPEYNFKIFGIEMVHIPQGAFELGDGVSTNSFNSITIDNTTTTIPTATLGGGIHQTIPQDFPKGYLPFYCMKYEVTQQQYVDFLNTLTFTQQLARTILTPAQLSTNPGAGGVCAMNSSCQSRNSIKLIKEGINNSRAGTFACDFLTAPADSFNSVNDGQNIVANYLSYSDLLSYLDWAALRPMTNFEFEKISRGPLSRIGGEYIWGTVNITPAVSSNLINSGKPSEISSSSGNGLAACNSIAANGPLRVGFSATGSTNRETSGSTYYGVMNFGGNVWEMVAGGSNTLNYGYKLTYANVGDGMLSVAGTFNTTNWQLYNSISYSSLGCGCCSSYIKWHMEMRGGSYLSAPSTLRSSDRSKNAGVTCGGSFDFGFGNAQDQRQSDVGGRGAR